MPAFQTFRCLDLTYTSSTVSQSSCLPYLRPKPCHTPRYQAVGHSQDTACLSHVQTLADAVPTLPCTFRLMSVPILSSKGGLPRCCSLAPHPVSYSVPLHFVSPAYPTSVLVQDTVQPVLSAVFPSAFHDWGHSGTETGSSLQTLRTWSAPPRWFGNCAH